MNNYIWYSENGAKETPFSINNSSEFNNNLIQGSFEFKITQVNITNSIIKNIKKSSSKEMYITRNKKTKTRLKP